MSPRFLALTALSTGLLSLSTVASAAPSFTTSPSASRTPQTTQRVPAAPLVRPDERVPPQQPAKVVTVVLPPDANALPNAAFLSAKTEALQVSQQVELAQLPKHSVPSSSPSKLNDRIDYNRSFGNSLFQAGYRVYNHLRSEATDFQSLNHTLEVWGEAFGRRESGVLVTGAVWNPRANYREARLKVASLGQVHFDTFSDSNSLTGQVQVAYRPLPIDRELFGSSKTFYASVFGLPIAIDVAASVHAQIGVDIESLAYRNSSSQNGLSYSANASGGMYAKASVGLEAYIADIEVEGRVNLVEAAVERDVWLDRQGGTTDYGNILQLKIGSLSGRIDSSGSVGFWPVKYDWSKKLLDWDGFETSFALVNDQGQIVQGFRPVMMDVSPMLTTSMTRR